MTIWVFKWDGASDFQRYLYHSVAGRATAIIMQF